MTTPDRPPVVIVGAGLAGLAAAVHLSLHGIPVKVLEQRRHAGGRTYSFLDEASGDVVDNGQHALIGAYTATMEFLDLLGTRRHLLVQDRPLLMFHHPLRGLCSFELPLLPAPFHLLAGLLTTSLCSFPDRLRLIRAGMMLRTQKEKAIAPATVAQWLRSAGQSKEAIRSFWEPLTLAIMNEHAERASALLFTRCLRRAFLAGPRDATMCLPTVGLSDLLVNPACAFVERRGGSILTGENAEALAIANGEACGVRTTGGSTHDASAVVLATPPWSIRGTSMASLFDISHFSESPIVSIHLWYESEFMEQTEIGVVDRNVQWIFNSRKIAERKGRGGHLSCVISAASSLVQKSNEELARIAGTDVCAVFGQRVGTPRRSLVIREKRATFSPVPALEQHRPPQLSPIPRLFLAGDWTATGLPGTIEGAVWSGRECARLIQAQNLL